MLSTAKISINGIQMNTEYWCNDTDKHILRYSREKPVLVPLCPSTKNPIGTGIESSMNILGERPVTNQEQDTHIYVHMDEQDCTYYGCQANQVTKLHTVSSNICESSVQNLLHITFLEHTIFRCVQDFWKICGPAMYHLM